MNLKILFFQILHYLQFYYHHKKYWVDCLNKLEEYKILVKEETFTLYQVTPYLGRLKSHNEFTITFQNNNLENGFNSYISDIFPQSIKDKIDVYENYENMITVRIKTKNAHAVCFASIVGNYVFSPVNGTWVAYLDTYVPLKH